MRQQIIRLCAATIRMLFVAVLASGATLAQSQPSQVRVFQPGIHIDNFPLPNGLTIRYAISIPKNYSPTNPVPLVLALHYGGSPNGAAQGVLLTLVQPALADLGGVPIGPTETRIAELRKAGVQADLVVLTGISHHETQRFTDGLRRAVPWLKGIWK